MHESIANAPTLGCTHQPTLNMLLIRLRSLTVEGIRPQLAQWMVQEPRANQARLLATPQYVPGGTTAAIHRRGLGILEACSCFLP